MPRLGSTLYPLWRDERAHGVQRLIPVWDYAYPRQLAFVRTLAGLWFVILTVILLADHRGETWACCLSRAQPSVSWLRGMSPVQSRRSRGRVA